MDIVEFKLGSFQGRGRRKIEREREKREGEGDSGREREKQRRKRREGKKIIKGSGKRQTKIVTQLVRSHTG